MGLAENLKRIRIKKGINQTEIGRIANLTPQMISKIETDVNKPSLYSVIKIAKALDCSLDELCEGEIQ